MFQKARGQEIVTILGALVGDRRVRTPGGRVVTVPPGYRRRPVSREWLARTWCQAPVDEVDAVEFGEWLRLAAKQRDAWMTLRDVVGNLGRRHCRVYALHRNAGDESADPDANPRGRAVNPQRFFRNCLATLRVATADPQGALVVRLEFKHTEFETGLEVEYRPGFWYPLDERGFLPARDPQGLFGPLLGRKTHWTALDPGTRVGFRGGFLAPQALRRMPPVCYT